ncbi:MAG: pentapeptide repeat-containing protein, partial [Alphaproteobacteria bacterium]|nr:pentapeptide repeat-containing protein [Alphaproteobacteria bacterium]
APILPCAVPPLSTIFILPSQLSSSLICTEPIQGAIIDQTTVLPYNFAVDKFLEQGGKIQIDWSKVPSAPSTKAQAGCKQGEYIKPTEEIKAFFNDPIAYVMKHKTRPSLYNVDLKGINLKDKDKRNPGVVEGMNFRGANLSGQYLSWMNFRGVNLNNANLSGAKILGTNFYGAEVSGVTAAPWQILFARGVNDMSRIEPLVTEKQRETRGIFDQIHTTREDDWTMMNLSYVLEALNLFKGR